MEPLLSVILSSFFLILGAVAVYTMASVYGGRTISNPRTYIVIHRIIGWLFAVLFVVMFVLMLQRGEEYWEAASPRVNTHITLAVSLILLLVLKVTIPRFFPKLNKNLLFLGITVYLMSFILVGVTGGYYLMRKLQHAPYISHANLEPNMLDETLGRELFIEKCATCHVLESIMAPRSPKAWEKVVNDMMALGEPRIAEGEANIILNYLATTRIPKPLIKTGEVSLIDKHCLPCHVATDIFPKQYNRIGWTEIVKQMTQYDPEIVPTEKTDEIVNYLLNIQQSE
jgi:uncharacterized protein YjeT (DUF2065 family)